MKYPIPELRLTGGPCDGRVLKDVRGAYPLVYWRDHSTNDIFVCEYRYTFKDGEVSGAIFKSKRYVESLTA